MLSSLRLHRHRRCFAAVAFGLSLVLATGAASADKAGAQAHFSKGQTAFSAKDFMLAAREFEEAYRLEPHHAPLWNAALSWQNAGDNVRAANLLVRYLREAPPGAQDRDAATAALKELSQKLGRIVVYTAGGVTEERIDGVRADHDGVFVLPGEHVILG